MVDRQLVGGKVARVMAAVQRIREFLPARSAQFGADQTAMDVVVLNLFVAIQQVMAIATHLLADSGLSVPGEYAGVFDALGKHKMIDPGLAERLVDAAKFRDLIARQCAKIDPLLVYRVASQDVDDLLAFCRAVTPAR